MSAFEYINEMVNGDDQVSETEAEEITPVESEEDLSLDSEVNSEETDKATEPESELILSLKKQIEGMEKRLNDKDSYINELREASKQREAESQKVDTEQDEVESFWDDPEAIIKAQKAEIQKQNDQMRMQSLQIAEIHYANMVENYWSTVNPDALKEAVSTDPEFAKTFNNSPEPYKVAYEYLKDATSKKQAKEASIEAEYERKFKEKYGIKEQKRDVPPNINVGSKSQSSTKSAPEDGFASVFGGNY